MVVLIAADAHAVHWLNGLHSALRDFWPEIVLDWIALAAPGMSDSDVSSISCFLSLQPCSLVRPGPPMEMSLHAWTSC
eukprot:5955347-Amphidinium_carterae.1